MLPVSEADHREAGTLSAPTHVSIHSASFSSNKHLTCFTAFHLCGNPFLQNRRAMILSLATGLVVRVQCSHSWGLTSTSGQKLKSCFQLLPVKAAWDHLYPLSFFSYRERDPWHTVDQKVAYRTAYTYLTYMKSCTNIYVQPHRHPYCLEGCLQGVTNLGWYYKIQWLRNTVLKVECLNSNFNFPT